VFERIAHELSGYYLLAFQATEKDRDDRVHRIDVKLQHRRATLRGREAFTLATQPPKGSTIEDRLAALLRAPNLASGLSLRVATYTYQEPGTAKVRVVVSAETDAATDEVSTPTLAFVLLDERNVIAASATHPVPLTILTIPRSDASRRPDDEGRARCGKCLPLCFSK
jgi:hypothetical protein